MRGELPSTCGSKYTHCSMHTHVCAYVSVVREQNLFSLFWVTISAAFVAVHSWTTPTLVTTSTLTRSLGPPVVILSGALSSCASDTLVS